MLVIGTRCPNICLSIYLPPLFLSFFPLLLLLPMLLLGAAFSVSSQGKVPVPIHLGETAPPAGWAPPFLPGSRPPPARPLASFGSAPGGKGLGPRPFSTETGGSHAGAGWGLLMGLEPRGLCSSISESRHLSRVSLGWEDFPWKRG